MMNLLETKGSIPEIVRNDYGLYEGNLIGYFRNVFNHADNLFNPYHNFRHICHVLWLCYQACIFYQERIDMLATDMRCLLIAALFHDFDHTGTAGPDSVNIERAIDGLRKYIEPKDKSRFYIIENIIRHTEFPYETPSEELGLLSQIMRDADLSQSLSVAWIQQVIFGLATEWDKTPLEVLKIQEPFLSDLSYSTLWAQEMFPGEAIESKIQEANELVELLSGETVPA